MEDFPYRVMNSFLGWDLIPPTLRTLIMQRIGFRVARTACIWGGASLLSRKVSMGQHVFVNVGFFHDGHDELVIEDRVRIGQFVRIITATHEIGPSSQRCSMAVVGKPVRIREGCWIGSGVTLLPGVTVEKGCVVAANAVVQHSTEPDGLYAGNPARRVRDLPSP
jgi:maltose O-acetyltransferase